MRKTKIILPVLTGLAITSSVVPLVSCSKENIKEIRTWALETISNYANEFSRFINTSNELPTQLKVLKEKADKYINECNDSLKIKSMVYFARHAFVATARQPEGIEIYKASFSQFDSLSKTFDEYKFQAQVDLLGCFIDSFSRQPEARGKLLGVYEKTCQLIRGADCKERALAFALMGNGAITGISMQAEAEGHVLRDFNYALDVIRTAPIDQAGCFGCAAQYLLIGLCRQPEASVKLHNLTFSKKTPGEEDDDCLVSLSKSLDLFGGDPEVVDILSRYFTSLIIGVANNPELAGLDTATEFITAHDDSLMYLGKSALPYALKIFSAYIWKTLQMWFQREHDILNNGMATCLEAKEYLFLCVSDAKTEKMGQLFIDFMSSAPFNSEEYEKQHIELIKKADAILAEEDELVGSVFKKDSNKQDSYKISISCSDQAFAKYLCLDNVIAWKDDPVQVKIDVLSDMFNEDNIRLTGIKMGNRSLVPNYDFVWDQYTGTITIFEPAADDITLSIQYYET